MKNGANKIDVFTLPFSVPTAWKVKCPLLVSKLVTCSFDFFEILILFHFCWRDKCTMNVISIDLSSLLNLAKNKFIAYYSWKLKEKLSTPFRNVFKVSSFSRIWATVELVIRTIKSPLTSNVCYEHSQTRRCFIWRCSRL